MTDEAYMRRAIALARRGEGWTNPNPMVGAVVVKDGQIIGEGWHPKCGELHAERRALLSCTQDPEGATIYVTLEPCCHHGRTPPCTEIIIEKKLARVVIGSRDPNPKVAGRGARLLREAGIQVEEDFLREECDTLNPIFFHYITTKKPYGILKYAMTLDGKIATRTGASKWITGETARAHVHTLRNRCSGIVAGIGTVLADDPLLNCRMEGGSNPLRVICDNHLRLPLDSQIARTAEELPTVIFCGEMTDEMENRRIVLEAKGIRVCSLPGEEGRLSLSRMVEQLGQEGIDSLLWEGGGTLHEAALREKVVQHVCAYIAPKLFGGEDAKSPVEGQGVALPDECTRLTHRTITLLGEDILLEYDVEEG